MNQKELQDFILHNAPTKILLKAYKALRAKHIKELMQYDNWYLDSPSFEYKIKHIVVSMGRFAYWNPNKGSSGNGYYTTEELKLELDKRENVK